MYERFTDRARKVMQLANQEAMRFNHEYIGTEHILLGLVSEGTGVASNVLKNLDIDLGKIRREVEKIVQAGPDVVTMGKLPHTPRAKKVVEYAIEESRNLNHNYVGTEHLLLGLLREQETVAAQILMNLGLSMTSVRDEVIALLGHNIATATMKPGVPPESLFDLPPKIALAIAAVDELVRILCDMKENAISRQDFEWAANVRDQEDKLRKMREWLLRNKDHEPPEPPRHAP